MNYINNTTVLYLLWTLKHICIEDYKNYKKLLKTYLLHLQRVQPGSNESDRNLVVRSLQKVDNAIHRIVIYPVYSVLWTLTHQIVIYRWIASFTFRTTGVRGQYTVDKLIQFSWIIFLDLRNTFLVGCMLLCSSFLAPVFWQLWIYAGSANANFFFAITLAYSTAQV